MNTETEAKNLLDEFLTNFPELNLTEVGLTREITSRLEFFNYPKEQTLYHAAQAVAQHFACNNQPKIEKILTNDQVIWVTHNDQLHPIFPRQLVNLLEENAHA